MRQASLSAFLGPALVLYLVADVASISGDLSPLGGVVAVAAALSSLFAFAFRGYEAQRGMRRATALSIGLGLALVRLVDPRPMSLLADLSHVTGLALAAAMLTDLALRVPDAIVSARPLRWATRATYLAFVAVWGAELLALLPPPVLLGTVLIVPPLGGQLALGALAVACVLALALRLSRRALRSTPEALAENTWAVFGLLPATPLVAFVALSPVLHLQLPPFTGALTLSAAALLLAASHRRLVDAEQRLRVGRASRRLVTGALALGLAFSACGYLLLSLPASFASGGLIALLGVALFTVAQRSLAPLVHASLAPARGHLLRALPLDLHLRQARRMEPLVAEILQRLRDATGSRDSDPRVHLLDPLLEGRIDAAGQAHISRRPLHPALLDALRAEPGEIIVRSALEARRVRAPTLRPLIDALLEPDLLCVVPLTLEGELEGALLVPRAGRRSALTLEEIDVLHHFATTAAAALAALGAEARAQERSHHAQREAERLMDRDEQLQDELDRLRADAVVLRAGRLAHRMQEQPIAYSPAMRALLTRIDAVAASDAPLLLSAEGGTPLESLAFRVHEQSGRGNEAFVIADCAAIAAEDAMGALFGDADNPHVPGLLKLAGEGTLLLLDVPALPLPVQAALSEALSTRQARPMGAAESFIVTTRLIAGSRIDLIEAAERERFDLGLAQRLSALTLQVPPLRERSEDLESLILLALARACSVHGRDVVGIDPEATAVLRGYEFPGNQGELRSIIERAVARCSGKRIAVSDLPTMPTTTAPEEAAAELALSGTLESVERAALTHAMARSNGNKSEAARLLGLKRTTFLDKLRRHGLEDTPAKPRPRAD